MPKPKRQPFVFGGKPTKRSRAKGGVPVRRRRKTRPSITRTKGNKRRKR